MKRDGHIVKKTDPGSIAEEMEIAPGDKILQINGEDIEDIFDYQYLIQDEYIEVLVKKPDGDEWLLEIDKDEQEDLGIEFENGLMDEYRSCRNKCIFCFIDQMPEGMRDTLYFKDDDSRLSFLQGNYVTLTNMSEHDVDRIIKYHLEPINISFQTMNKELRCMMLNNRFAGKALEKVDAFYEAGITMNGQIVLCKGINDGKELDFSIRELTKYHPYLESVSVVPVGLSKFREGLYPLEPFLKEDAKEVLKIIHKWQDHMYEKFGTHFIHASDEWYLLAEEPLPPEENYDGYLQLENGVGMLTLLKEEFKRALQKEIEKNGGEPDESRRERMTLVTGKLAYPTIKEMSQQLMKWFPGLKLKVEAITNVFFGEQITVSGLLTGQDIISQLKGKELGDRILLPQNVLRSGENYFLDDVTIPQMEETLQVRADIVKSSGQDFVDAVLYGNRRQRQARRNHNE